ncbi:MAG: response regulator [Sulfurimonas sp.]|uniref:response regulator n=1 Tax=Sulfurimonas sp. TaxID=2022749 RepID=UPI002613D2A0|nr:response regulator [Sulfurimonas sp.]MDD2652037.1 response regulator [Sulfurimonas sp.]MDD3452054.1 response regulator [Sulfurimonas sp.]
MQNDIDASILGYLGSLTLLCVEENEAAQFIYASIFKDIVKEIVFASNCEEGIEKFALHKVDIIITDYSMPHLNGIEMIKRIKGIDTEVPIIFVTAIKETDIIIEALRLGVNNFLKKPIVASEVIQAVENAAKIVLADRYLKKQREKKIKELEKKEKYNSFQEELAFAKELNILRNDFYYQMHENNSVVLIDFFYKPLDVLSGDSYSAREIDKDTQFYFIIDGMGKGLSASLTSMLLTSHINHIIDKRVRPFDLKEVVNEAVDYIKPILLDEEAIAADFVVIDYKNLTMEYAKFAMPPSLMQSNTNEIVKIKSNNPPLSKYTSQTNVSSLDILNMMKFLFYSDGVVESSMRGRCKPYTNYLERDFLSSFSKDELREKILWQIEEQEDDMTFVFINRLDYTTSATVNKSFETSLAAVEEANDWYVNFWASLTSDYKLAYNAGVVFTELFMNAYEHGNLGVDAQTKHKLMEEDNYFTTLEKLDKACNKKIEVSVSTIYYSGSRYITTTIRDEGDGFDTQILSKIFRDRKNFNGRGVYISRQSSRGIYYNAKGTSVLFLHKIEEGK